MSIFTKIFSTGAKEVVGTVGAVLDNLITSKEEKEAAKLAIEQEINRHMEALQDKVLKEKELDVQDRASARTRESDFVKATGRADYFQYFIGSLAVITTCVIIFILLFNEIPQKNEHVIMLFIGEILGIVTGIYSYHFGSSMGSRLKDMRSNASK